MSILAEMTADRAAAAAAGRRFRARVLAKRCSAGRSLNLASSTWSQAPSRVLAALSRRRCGRASVAAATWWRLPIWGAGRPRLRDRSLRARERLLRHGARQLLRLERRRRFLGAAAAGPAFPGYVATVLIADSKTPGRLWAALAGQYAGGLVVRSDNRGADWTILARWKETVATRSLALVPGDPAAARGRRRRRRAPVARRRRDLDANRRRRRRASCRSNPWPSIPPTPAILYAGTWRQAFRTRDGGETGRGSPRAWSSTRRVYSWDFAGSDPARHLGLDLRLGLPHEGRRGPAGRDSRTASPTAAPSAVRRDPDAARRGLRRDSRAGSTGRWTAARTWSRISRESLVVTALEVDRATGRLYVGTEGKASSPRTTGERRSTAAPSG